MKYLAFGLALLASGAGMIAAWYWYRASEIKIVPYGRQAPYGRSAGLMEMMAIAANLNKTAALWTAASVALGTLSTLAGAWPMAD